MIIQQFFYIQLIKKINLFFKNYYKFFNLIAK